MQRKEKQVLSGPRDLAPEAMFSFLDMKDASNLKLVCKLTRERCQERLLERRTQGDLRGTRGSRSQSSTSKWRNAYPTALSAAPGAAVDLLAVKAHRGSVTAAGNGAYCCREVDQKNEDEKRGGDLHGCERGRGGEGGVKRQRSGDGANAKRPNVAAAAAAAAAAQ